MKREFEREKIGRKMPYVSPKEEFFDNFKRDMIERIQKEEPQKQRLNLKLFIPIFAAAASLLVGLFIIDRVDSKLYSEQNTALISENVDASIESYFNNLSDDELAYLINKSSSQDDFYLTLPTNE